MTTPAPPYSRTFPRTYHSEPAFLRAHALLTDTHDDLLTLGAQVELAWCRLELTQGGQHQPTEWEPLDLTPGTTGLQILTELERDLTQLITDSTDLATTLRYHRARTYARSAITQTTAQTPAPGDSPDHTGDGARDGEGDASR